MVSCELLSLFPKYNFYGYKIITRLLLVLLKIRADFGFSRLIEECWNEKPALRPTFKQIIPRLESIYNKFGHKRRWKVNPSVIMLFFTISMRLSGVQCICILNFHIRVNEINYLPSSSQTEMYYLIT